MLSIMNLEMGVPEGLGTHASNCVAWLRRWTQNPSLGASPALLTLPWEKPLETTNHTLKKASVVTKPWFYLWGLNALGPSV